ncbi:MAG: G1 family glutamic endopeptidase [Actinomycetota bacterium]
MKAFRTLVVAGVFAVIAFPGGSFGAAPVVHVRHGASLNWSGYSATGGQFASVAAAWTQPAVTCAALETSYAGFWVGIDGDGSSTVEQIGTAADCKRGTPAYYAWYEMYPKFPVTLTMSVSPGDVVEASVEASNRGTFILSLRNTTTGASFTTTKKMRRAQRISAEVIAEAPSGAHGVLPLADFGTVSFVSSTANGIPIGNFSPEQIAMVDDEGTIKAQPSSLTGATDFSVTWQHP